MDPSRTNRPCSTKPVVGDPAFDASFLQGRGVMVALLIGLVMFGLVRATPASAAVEFRGAASAGNASTAYIDIPRPVVSSGDVMVAAIGVRGSTIVTAPSGWTAVRQDSASTSLTHVVYVRMATAMEPTSYRFPLSLAIGAAGGIAAYSGAMLPVNAHAGSSSSKKSANVLAPSVNSSTVDGIVIRVFGLIGSHTFTAPTGSSERFDRSTTSGSYITSISLADRPRGLTTSTGTATAVANGSGARQAGQTIVLAAAAAQSDTTAPTVALSSPAAGATLTGAATLAATASDSIGVAKVEFLVDNGVVATDTSSPYSVSWDSATSANGTHTIAARAVDTSGNTATSASRSVTVSNSTSSTPPPSGTAPIQPGSYLIIDRTKLLSLPTTGTPWTTLVNAANQTIVPNLADQDNKGSSVAFAAGLLYARTGNTVYRDKVIAALTKLPGTEYGTGGRVLSSARQLAGYVMAADLVGYRDAAFVSWVSDMRTKNIAGGHGRFITISQTHENTASNWGGFAGASRVAASLYVGDLTDVQRASVILRGFTGDRAAWPGLPAGKTTGGFQRTADFDPTWACTPDTWVPINPDCGDRNGALVEDISRGDAYPVASNPGYTYSWEVMQGVILQALLLERAGYTDVWQWQNQALRRTHVFMQRWNGFTGDFIHPVDYHVTWVINRKYGTTYPTYAAGYGREFGFTDWLT